MKFLILVSGYIEIHIFLVIGSIDRSRVSGLNYSSIRSHNYLVGRSVHKNWRVSVALKYPHKLVLLSSLIQWNHHHSLKSLPPTRWKPLFADIPLSLSLSPRHSLFPVNLSYPISIYISLRRNAMYNLDLFLCAAHKNAIAEKPSSAGTVPKSRS